LSPLVLFLLGAVSARWFSARMRSLSGAIHTAPDRCRRFGPHDREPVNRARRPYREHFGAPRPVMWAGAEPCAPAALGSGLGAHGLPGGRVPDVEWRVGCTSTERRHAERRTPGAGTPRARASRAAGGRRNHHPDAARNTRMSVPSCPLLVVTTAPRGGVRR